MKSCIQFFVGTRGKCFGSFHAEVHVVFVVGHLCANNVVSAGGVYVVAAVASAVVTVEGVAAICFVACRNVVPLPWLSNLYGNGFRWFGRLVHAFEAAHVVDKLGIVYVAVVAPFGIWFGIARVFPVKLVGKRQWVVPAVGSGVHSRHIFVPAGYEYESGFDNVDGTVPLFLEVGSVKV